MNLIKIKRNDKTRKLIKIKASNDERHLVKLDTSNLYVNNQGN